MELIIAVNPRRITDPVETIVAQALDDAGIRYVHESEMRGGGLDFWLPDFKTTIEVKRFHTERINNQLRAAGDCILIQGMGAAQAFVDMLAGFTRLADREDK